MLIDATKVDAFELFNVAWRRGQIVEGDQLDATMLNGHGCAP